MDGIGRLGWIQVDCADPVRLATFWGHLLGREVDLPLGTPPQYVGLVPDSRHEPVVSFQRVPEPKSGKNRLHFDIAVEDVEDATLEILARGGARGATGDFEEHGFRWRTMSDPEANEFCLIYTLD
jgi:predicted enzyme related to lactoylglutathione lyase